MAQNQTTPIVTPIGTRAKSPGAPIINADGSHSTEQTISVGFDGQQFLLPTIIPDENGVLQKFSNDDAIRLFREGKNKPVGVFDTVEAADNFAKNRSASGGRFGNTKMAEGIVKIGDNELTITAPTLEELNAKAKELANLPEAKFPNASLRQMGRLGLAFFTTPDTQSRIDIIKDVLPDAKIIPLGADNAIVDHQGALTILNKPGISTGDIADVASGVVKFLPAGKAAQAASAGGRLLATGVGAATSGLTSVAEDVAAGAQGSEQGIVGEKVALDTVLGGGSEILQPLIARLISSGRNALRNPDAAIDAVLTPDVQQQLADAGISLRQARQAMREVVEREGTEALSAAPGDFAAAARSAEAGDLGVDLTRGQANRNFGQLSREDTLRTADVTSRAGETLRAFDDTQQGQLRGAAGEVQERIAGGSGAPLAQNVDEAGETVVEGLKASHRAAQREVDAAYEAARQLNGEFTAESVGDMAQAVRTMFREGDDIVTRDLHPATSEILNRLGQLERLVRGSSGGAANVRPKPFQINRIESIRRSINGLIDSAEKGSQDRRLALKAKRAVDGWIDEAIDTAVFTGDDQALEALKKARAANTRLNRQFGVESKYDDAGKIVDNLLNREVSGRETVNYIFGTSALGAKRGTAATVNKLREVLPPEQFAVVKEGAWLRVMEKAMADGQFSRRKAMSAINDALNGKGKAAMEALFTPDELIEIRRFRRVIASTITPEDATGPSGTPRKIAQMAQQLGQKLGLAISATTQNPFAALLAFTPAAQRRLDFAAARRAVSGFRIPAQAPAATAAGVALGREGIDREDGVSTRLPHR